MGEFDLNLSTRPFPAYQLKTILFTIAAIVLIALSAWQAYGFMHYSQLAGQIRGEARNSEVESEALSRRLADLDSRLNRPEAMAKLNEIEFFNNIIARKTLSWTRLFAVLEDLTPENVRLISLRPNFEKDGGILIHFEVSARSIPDVKEYIEALQSTPLFTDVIVTHEQKKQSATGAPPGTDVDVAFNAKYRPEREGQ